MSIEKTKFKRTLFTAGVFALLAMAVVPTPHDGYRFVFSPEDTNIAFFQLLLNVVFAALLGAILATVLRKISKRALYVAAGCIAFVALGVGVHEFTHDASNRAKRDEKNAEELLGWYPTDSQWMLTKFRNAAINWRLALRFDEATRVENKINELQQHPPLEVRKAKPLTAEEFLDLPDQGPKGKGRKARAPTASNPFADPFADLIPESSSQRASKPSPSP